MNRISYSSLGVQLARDQDMNTYHVKFTPHYLDFNICLLATLASSYGPFCCTYCSRQIEIEETQFAFWDGLMLALFFQTFR